MAETQRSDGSPRVRSDGRTFTESARRAQIVKAAIETIAELGQARASYAQIAKRARLSSTGLISYHFADKTELIEEVVAHVVASGQSFMMPSVEAASPGRDRLRAYIASNLAYMASHRAEIVAVVQIFNAVPRTSEGQPGPYAAPHEQGIAQLEGYLRQGQQAGELRKFSVRVMAVTIRAAIDAAGYQVSADPGIDLDAYGRELANLFDRATTSA